MNDARSDPDMGIYRFIVHPNFENDPRSAGYLADASALGLTTVEKISCQDLYFIEGDLEDAEVDRLATRLLSDPLTQKIAWARLDGSAAPGSFHEIKQFMVEVALRPGVTDPTAEQIVRAAHILGIQGVKRATTGQRFLIQGQEIDEALLHQLASRLLVNATIQRYALGEIVPVFPHPANLIADVDTIPVREMAELELMALSVERRAALDL